MGLIDIGGINQHGYVVSNADAAALDWFERTGIGPFHVGDFTMDNFRYRGTETECRLRIAIAYWGNVQIELVQPLSAKGTMYEQVLPQCDGQLNHFSALVPDLDAIIAERDLAGRMVQSGEMRAMGIRFAYFEDCLPGGLLLELTQAPPAMREHDAAMQRRIADWDRSRPVRPFEAMTQSAAAQGG